jgi:hypothetical protein
MSSEIPTPGLIPFSLYPGLESSARITVELSQYFTTLVSSTNPNTTDRMAIIGEIHKLIYLQQPVWVFLYNTRQYPSETLATWLHGELSQCILPQELKLASIPVAVALCKLKL